MLEPQSTVFFLLMVVIFGGLMYLMVRARQTVFRVLLACLAFLPAMAFGLAAVNKYYDYYQNWNAAYADFTNAGSQTNFEAPAGVADKADFAKLLGNSYNPSVAAAEGLTLHLNVTGRVSHITRSVYVFLPPQYFQASYRHYRFPAIELLHGYPGLPQDWITVIGVPTMMDELLAQHAVKPAVLVMPNDNGARGVQLQCLNQYHGAQDATYLADDLPAWISGHLRVFRPGRAWGIAGYSEGGYCAANLGLRYSDHFGYSGVLSGYFKPYDNVVGSPPRAVSPFGGSKKLARLNTPVDYLQTLKPGIQVPEFWIGYGAGDADDAHNAALFQELVSLHQPGVQLHAVPGGGHTMLTWRVLMPALLRWMTPQQAQVVAFESRHPHAGATPSPSAAAGARHRRHHRHRRDHATRA